MNAYATIKLVSQIGRVLSSNVLVRNLTLALIPRAHDNSVTNALRCLCCQVALIPLSYAADLPISSNPDLANVRLTFSNVDHEVIGVGVIMVHARTNAFV